MAALAVCHMRELPNPSGKNIGRWKKEEEFVVNEGKKTRKVPEFLAGGFD
jgi:hypothetical protein